MFYVHIVESPSPEELLNGQLEGQALCACLNVAQIPYVYHTVVNATQLKVALTDKVDEWSQRFGVAPILHFSTHGGTQGVQLTDQRESYGGVSWYDLGANYIRPVNQKFGGIVGVCMSCCGGANGSQMAMVVDPKDLPFAWLIGPHSNIAIADAALAYAVLYRRIHSGCYDENELILAMNKAAGADDFEFLSGEITRTQYCKFLTEAFAKMPPPPANSVYGQPIPQARPPGGYGFYPDYLQQPPQQQPPSGYGYSDYLQQSPPNQPPSA